MFCPHCGMKLSDDAKFCSACGGAVGNNQQPAQNSGWQQNSYQQPTQNSGWQQNSYQQPTQNSGWQQNDYQQPAQNSGWQQNQQSAYTAPVNSGYQYTAPVNNSQFTAPVNNNSQYTAPINKAPDNSRKKKNLAIIIGAVAIIAVVLVVALLGGGKDNSSSSSSKSGKVDAPAATTEPQSPSVLNKYPEGQLRFDSEGFYFTMDEFNALFDAKLAAEGVPMYVYDSYNEEENKCSFNLWHEGQKCTGGAYYAVETDPVTKRVTKISISFWPKEGDEYEDYNTDLGLACVYMVETAHGAIDDAKREQFLEASSIDLDGMTYRYHDFDSFATIVVEISGAGSSTSGSDSNSGSASSGSSDSIVDPAAALAKYPNGNERFDGSYFSFNHEDAMGLYLAAMEAEDLPFNIPDVTALEDNKYNYSLFTDDGEDVGWMIVTENGSGYTEKVSLNYTYQSDEDDHNHGVEAALCLIEAAHGAMTADDWNYIADDEPLTTKDDYIMYKYEIDGMVAFLTLYTDRLFIQCYME